MLAARLVDVALHRLAGRGAEPPDEESFEEDIRTIVTEGHREGLLEEEAREMIEGVIELGDVDVSRIMTPRTDMVSLAASLSWAEMLEQVVNAGHTRIPVYGRNRDDILGILHAKDLLLRAGQAGGRAGRALDQAAARADVRARNQAGRLPAPGDCSGAATTWSSCWTSTAASPAW